MLRDYAPLFRLRDARAKRRANLFGIIALVILLACACYLNHLYAIQ